MDKKTRILAIVAAVGASILIISSPSGSIMIPKPNTSPTGTDAVQIVGTNLQKLRGVIKFGPDKKLYIGTGDATNEDSTQDLNSLAGKILQLNDDSSIPYGNPISNFSVYSYGHRNPQGLAWDDKGNLYETEEGPTKNYEVSLVRPGQNYGWPNQECSGSKDYQDALLCYNPSIEPAGIAYYKGGKLELGDDLILATLRGDTLYQLYTKNGTITSQKIILDGLGRIREVGQGQNGYLYILTGNTDGKGFPDKNDDKLLRIVK